MTAPAAGRWSAGRARPRVLFLATSYPVYEGAAEGVFVARLAESLIPFVRVLVLAPCPPAAAKRSPRARGRKRVRVVCLRYAPARLRLLAQGPGGIPASLARRPWLWVLVPALLWAMFVGARRALRGACLLHAHWAVCGAVGGLAARLRGRPVVTTLRGEDVNRAARSFVHRLVLRACVALSSRVVVVSEALAQRVRRLVQAADPIVIPNGVGPEFFELDPPSRGDHFEVLFIGSLIPRKRPDLLVEALRTVPGARLTLLGDGPERPHLESMARAEGLSRRVRFMGQVAPERVLEYLSSAEAVVVSSEREGRPNALLEAMAAGRAVVVSDFDGAAEVVEDGVSGLMFPRGDADALAARLRSLQEDPAMARRLGQAARARMRSLGLRWEDTAARYARLYEELLSEHGGVAGEDGMERGGRNGAA